MQGAHRPRRRAAARLSLAAAALCLLAAVAPLAAPAGAAPGGTLSMNPSNTSLDVGDFVALTLDVSGGVDLHEVHVGVTYNPSVLQVVDADAAPGVQVLPGAFPGTDAEGSVLQNTVSSGIINYQYALDAANEVSGSGTIATVQFEALATGNGNLAWTTRQFIDGNGVSSTPAASAAIVVVGQPAPTPTDTAVATASATAPASTSTPQPTATTAPGTATATHTPTVTRTASPTRTPADATPTVAVPTATPRITVLQNANVAAPTPRSAGQGGVDPSQTERANGLPDAGTEGPGIQWWRWTFFAAALLLGFAGWFFTFALHHGDREVMLFDRFDRRRRRPR